VAVLEIDQREKAAHLINRSNLQNTEARHTEYRNAVNQRLKEYHLEEIRLVKELNERLFVENVPLRYEIRELVLTLRAYRADETIGIGGSAVETLVEQGLIQLVK